MGLPEQDQVTKGTHGAKAAPLGQDPHSKAHARCDEQGGLRGAWTLDAVEEDPALTLSLDLGVKEYQGKKPQHDQRQEPSYRGVGLLRTPQVIAAPEKPSADPDAGDETEDTEDGIPIAACQTQHGPPRAAQEDQGPDQGKGTQT